MGIGKVWRESGESSKLAQGAANDAAKPDRRTQDRKEKVLSLREIYRLALGKRGDKSTGKRVWRADDLTDDRGFHLFIQNIISGYYAQGVAGKFWFSHNKKERTLIFLWSYRGTKIHSQSVDYDDLEAMMMQISMQRVG